MRTAVLLTLLMASAATAGHVDYQNKKITMRIVYVATTSERALANVNYVNQKTSKNPAAEPVEVGSGDSWTVIHLQLGEIRGFTTHFDLYTVPKAAKIRRDLMRTADAVIFVADGEPKRAEANAAAFKVLQKDLASVSLDWKTLPIVVQYESAGAAADKEAHHKALGLTDQQEFNADAKTGTGVFETLKAAAKLSLMALRDEANGETKAKRSAPDEAREVR